MRRRLTMDNHKVNCLNPFDIRRFSLRAIGGQSIAFGNMCMGCGNTERTDFTNRFKSKRVKAAAININREFSNEEIADFETLTHIRITDLRTTRRNRKSRLIITKIKSPETSLKSKLRGLESFYKTVSMKLRLYDNTNGENFGWDPKLCKRFLASKPTMTQLMIVIMGPRLEWIYSGLEPRERNRFIGYIRYTKDRLGWSRRDTDAYIEALKSEIEKRNEFMKLVILESKRRTRKKKISMLPLIYV